MLYIQVRDFQCFSSHDLHVLLCDHLFWCHFQEILPSSVVLCRAPVCSNRMSTLIPLLARRGTYHFLLQTVALELQNPEDFLNNFQLPSKVPQHTCELFVAHWLIITIIEIWLPNSLPGNISFFHCQVIYQKAIFHSLPPTIRNKVWSTL